MDNTYNGWRNHSTWAIGLHLMDTVVEIIMDDKDNWDIEEADHSWTTVSGFIGGTDCNV
jgi:hypothetical protein